MHISEIDRWCDEYEERLKAGEKLSVIEFVQLHGLPQSPQLLDELSRVQNEYKSFAALNDGNSVLYSASSVKLGDIAAPSTILAPCQESESIDPAAATRQTRDTSLPTQLGKYEVRKLLGQGSFGNVYLAHDSDLDRLVALKVPSSNHFSSSQAVESFLAEARTAARLDHPGIVRVHGVTRDSGNLVIVLEYVEGCSLADAIKSQSFDHRRIAEIVRQVAEAVNHANQAGLIHRDLKPANILINSEGRPRVADFGLAVHEDVQRSRKGEVAGSPAYMAPEQVRGETERLDGRTDQWSLGVILYELLTGRRPFAGDTREELFGEIEHRDPKPPRQIDSRIPVQLERICLKCLSKRMSDRYSTVGDLATALGNWESKQSVSSNGLSDPATGRVFGSPISLFRLIAVLAIVVAVGFGISLLLKLFVEPGVSTVADNNTDLNPGQESSPNLSSTLPPGFDLIPRDAAGFISFRFSDWPEDDAHILQLLQAFSHVKFEDQEYEQLIGDAVRSRQPMVDEPWFLSPCFWRLSSLLWSENIERLHANDSQPMERLTVVLLDEPLMFQWMPTRSGTGYPLPMDLCSIATSTEPYDRDEILDRLPGEGAIELDYKGYTYFVGEEPDLRAVYFVDDRTWISTTPASVLQQLFDRVPSEGTAGPLSHALVETAGSQELTIGVNPGWSNDTQFGTNFPAYLISHQVQTFTQLRAMTAVVDFVGLDNAAVPDLNVELQLLADEAAAVPLMQEGVEHLLEELTDKMFPPPLEFEDSDDTRLGFKVTAQWCEALRNTEFKSSDADLTVSFRIENDLTDELRAAVDNAVGRLLNLQNLEKIGLAIHTYSDSTSRNWFPPAFLSADDGTPLLSWRVLILPYLGEQELYERFHLDEPWDSPHNAGLVAEMPEVYQWHGDEPLGDGMTRVQVIMALNSAFPPSNAPYESVFPLNPDALMQRIPDEGERPMIGFFHLVDGTMNTLMVALGTEPVPWTKPADMSYSPEAPLPTLHHQAFDGPLILLANGTAGYLAEYPSEELLRALITRNGGEIVEFEIRTD